MVKTTALVLMLASTVVNAQNSTSDPEARQREVFQTYGYCYGQQRSIEQIKNEFPKLAFPMLQAETAFNVTFGKSCKVVGETFTEDLRRKLNQKFDETLPRSPITEDIALNFINKVAARASGGIESPVKETLLAFNPDFENNPALEFTRGLTRKYSTLGHAKARGLTLEIRVPASWLSREGNRPNIIQFFKGKYGRDDTAMVLMVNEFVPPKGMRVTKKDIDGLFSPSSLKDYVPDGAKVIESKSIVWEGEKAGMWIYEITEERLDVRITLRTLSFMTFYKNRFISMQFSTSGMDEGANERIKKFELNRPLFRMIANTLVITDKYKN